MKKVLLLEAWVRYEVPSVLSSFAIVLLRKRELLFYFNCVLVMAV